MTWAQIVDGVIQSVGGLPRSARRQDTGQWVMGLRTASTVLREACGYYEVADTQRPEDTATTTHVRSVELVDGTPTVVWTERDLTAQELAARDLDVARRELDRAVAVASAPTELEQVQNLSLSSEGIVDGDPWRQPSGAHDAYPVGATVEHNGKTWENLTAANVWEPGVSGWREVAACPEFVQPTGAHDAYNTGDCVTFEGQQWVSLIDANTWSPTDYPAGWELQ